MSLKKRAYEEHVSGINLHYTVLKSYLLIRF